MTILPNAIYRFLSNYQWHFSQNQTKNFTMHFTMFLETQKTLNNQRSLEKEDGTGGLNLPDFRLYYKATVIKTVCCWHQNRNIDQWNKIESSCTCGYNNFDKGGKSIQWDKDSLLNKWCWGNWTATCKRKKLEHFLTPYTKINSKWIKDLNVRQETIKLLEKSIGRTLKNINQRKILYDKPPRVMEIKTKVNNWELIKLKRFCTTKETISKV